MRMWSCLTVERIWPLNHFSVAIPDRRGEAIGGKLHGVELCPRG